MNWWSNAVRRFGSLDAISWPVFWVTLGAGVIGNLVTTTSSPLGWRVLTLVIGQLCMWLPLMLARRMLGREPGRSRPALVGSAAVVGLTLRALFVGASAAAFLGATDALWGQRFVGAVLNIGLAFVVAGYVVSGMRERRRQISELAAIESELAASVSTLSNEFDQRNDEALRQVQAVLLNELNRLEEADPQRSLEVLRHTAVDLVRPLSHQLARERPIGPSAAATATVEVSWPNVLDRAANGRPFRPLVTAALLGVESTAAAVAYRPGIPVYAAMLVVVIGLLVGANVVLATVLQGRSRATRMGLVASVAVLIGAMGASFVWAGLGDVPARGALTLGTFAFTVAFGLGASVAAAFARDRDRLVLRLQESSRELARVVVRLRQAQWFQNKVLSRALHGPIQAAVTAAALRLDAAIRSGEVDDRLVGRVREQLIDALGTLGSAEPHLASTSEALTRLRSTWDGLCEVSMKLPSGGAEMLARDSLLRSCVIDIVTEAVSNAVRHGGATRTEIEIAVAPADRDVLLLITSDGTRGRAERGTGLGTRILDDCTMEWNLEKTSTGVRLMAILPAGDPVSGSGRHALPAAT